MVILLSKKLWPLLQGNTTRHYLQEVSHDILGIVDHREDKSTVLHLMRELGLKIQTIECHSSPCIGIASPSSTHGYDDLPSFLIMPPVPTRIATYLPGQWKWLGMVSLSTAHQFYDSQPHSLRRPAIFEYISKTKQQLTFVVTAPPIK